MGFSCNRWVRAAAIMRSLVGDASEYARDSTSHVCTPVYEKGGGAGGVTPHCIMSYVEICHAPFR
jgi:hypothetical protein